MAEDLVWSRGVVVPGFGVASGRSADPRFPEGTIRPQLPAFRQSIQAFDAHLGGEPYPGTINVRMLGGAIMLGEPEFRIGPIRWTDALPPEKFLISTCVLDHHERRHPAYLYVPDPATKPAHHQAADIMEVLGPFIPDLAYGDAVAIGRAAGVFETDQR